MRASGSLLDPVEQLDSVAHGSHFSLDKTFRPVRIRSGKGKPLASLGRKARIF